RNPFRSLLDCGSPGFTMAVYISGRKPVATVRVWNTLAELREVAMARGCTPAQFAYSLEVMGTDTHHVANYLQRHEFMRSLPAHALEVA
ncbi:MAG: hypothetical protein P4L92_12805, partial [Rudaea sp.]|nr:hypothetical protein [Rudaea sp.]